MDPRERAPDATAVLGPIPTDLQPGQPWNATITFRDFYLDGHPIVEVDGFRPGVTLHNLDTGQMIGIAALATRPGVYVARVAFPEAGRWSILVRNGYNGISNDTTTISVPPATSALHSRAFPIWAWPMSGLLSLLVVTAAFLIVAWTRRRQPGVLG